MAIPPEVAQTLTDAAFAGNVDEVDRLLVTVPVNSRDKDGFAALHRVAVVGNVAMLTHLIKKGANVNLEDAYGDTPLHYASFCGHRDAALALIHAGGDPLKPSKDGKNAVQSALEEGHSALAEELQTLGAAKAPSKAPPRPPPVPKTPSYALPSAPKAAGDASTPLPHIVLHPFSRGPIGSAGVSVGGLNFSSGVILEGAIRKKRKNKIMKWRPKYFVLSRTYNALFFWTGTRDKVEGTIKKIRFETFLWVRHFPTKQEGKRFALRVLSGRVMQLLASTKEEAIKWVETLQTVLGPSMSAARIQAVWRGWRARKHYKKLKLERNAAVARLAHNTAGVSVVGGKLTSTSAGAGATAAKMTKTQQVHGAIKSAAGKTDSITFRNDAILLEGELKKKSSTSISRFFASYRTRYFVLYPPDASLYYFESKAQRTLGANPRAIPFLSFYTVTHLPDRRGGKSTIFILKVISGRSFIFETRNVKDAANWVEKLLAVLPRENAAAIKIQTAYRGWKARKAYKAMRAASITTEQAVLAKYAGGKRGLSADAVKKAALIVQKMLRMHVARKRYRGFMLQREQAEQLAEREFNAESRKQRTQKQVSPWNKYTDKDSGRPYWHNPATNETTWTDPDSPVYAGWKELTDFATKKVYYHNIASNEVRWELPAEARVAKETAKPKTRWIKKTEPGTHRTFFANVDSGETNWLIPVAIREGSGRLLGAWFSKADAASGLKYFIRADTNATTWDRPDGYESDEDYADDLMQLADWVEVMDPVTKKPYFYSMSSKRRRWDNVWAGVGTRRTAAGEGPGALPTTPQISAPSTPGASELPNVVDISSTSRRTRTPAGSRRGSDAGRRTPVAPATPKPSAADTDAATPAEAATSVWSEHVDPDSGRPYYYNAKTGETTWTRPAELDAPIASVRIPADDVESVADEIAVYDANEVLTLALFANDALQRVAANADIPDGSKVSSRLPISIEAEPPALFAAMRDGVLPAALVTSFAPDTLDLRVVDFEAHPLNKQERRKKSVLRRKSSVGLGSPETAAQHSDPALENCRLALSAAQSCGAMFSMCNPSNLADGQENAVLEFVWECMRLSVLTKVSLRSGSNKHLLQLALPDETVDDLMALQPDTILLRWINYHLRRAGSALVDTITAFGAQLQDGVALASVIRSVAPDCCADVPASDAAATELGAEATVTAVLSAAFAAGVPAMFSVEGITAGNEKLQQAFCAYLLQSAPGLVAAEPATPTVAATTTTSTAASATAKSTASGSATSRATTAALDKLAAELSSRVASQGAAGEGGAREIASIAQWLNSLSMGTHFVRPETLASDLKDGTTLLSALDQVEPGLVQWQRVNKKPGANRYKQVENCNYLISLGRAMDFHLVNVGGLDIVDGNEKLLKAFMWQLMRYSTMKQLSQVAFDGFSADETEILRWANERVGEQAAAFGHDPALFAISSFSEPSLASGIYLLYLLSGVGCHINWADVANGETRAEQVANAKYVLSLARKRGVQVLCSYEDIVEVRAKPLMLFVALVMVADGKSRQGLEDGFSSPVRSRLGSEHSSEEELLGDSEDDD